MSVAELRQAAELIRSRAQAAAAFPEERWMVDQAIEDGLVLGSFGPDDIGEDGVVSTACVAYFAYPGDEEHRTHSRALPAASHIAGWDPQTAEAVADWLDRVADRWDEGAPDAAALRVARTYLRSES